MGRSWGCGRGIRPAALEREHRRGRRERGRGGRHEVGKYVSVIVDLLCIWCEASPTSRLPCCRCQLPVSVTSHHTVPDRESRPFVFTLGAPQPAVSCDTDRVKLSGAAPSQVSAFRVCDCGRHAVATTIGRVIDQQCSPIATVAGGKLTREAEFGPSHPVLLVNLRQLADPGFQEQPEVPFVLTF